MSNKFEEIYKNLTLAEQISEAVSTAYQIGTLTKVQIQFSFVENLEQTNLPTDSDSDWFSSIYYLLIIFPLIYSQFLSNYLQLIYFSYLFKLPQ